MKNLPDKIYLNLGDLTEEVLNDIDFHDLSEVTWSDDDVQGRNVEYVRKDVLIDKAAVVSELKDLYEDIDRCIGDLVLAKSKHYKRGVFDAHWKMETLMINTQQVLSYILQHLEMKEIQEEPVNEELEDITQKITYEGEVYTRCYKDKLDEFACKYPISVPKPPKRYAKYSDTDLTIAVKEGAKWQRENLWKPTDGDDLPEIDREVIALLDNGKVVYAHRPSEYWDGKDIITGKATRYYPKTYDNGGWNIPNIKYWLDYDINELLCRENETDN